MFSALYFIVVLEIWIFGFLMIPQAEQLVNRLSAE